MSQTRWYRYRQNNSGGEFTGPALTVFIEAESAVGADARAEEIGLYFGGIGDCPCCGDRWYPTYESQDTEPVFVEPSNWDRYSTERAGIPEAIKLALGSSTPVVLNLRA